MSKQGMKRLKKGLTLIFACIMLLANMNVFAAEGRGTDAFSNVSSKEYKYHFGVGDQGKLGVTLYNSGEAIDLSAYDLSVRGVEGAEGVTLSLLPQEDMTLPAANQYGEGTLTLPVSYAILADCKAPVITYVVDIFEKGNSTTPVYTTKETRIYPYSINGDVLNYNDQTRPSEYELKVETGEGIVFDGAIYSDGQWTEIYDEEGTPCRWFLKPGYPQAYLFEIQEGYQIAVAQLVPADAGTVSRVQGQPGTFKVDLHAPATLKVTSSKLDTQNWMNTVENYVLQMQLVDMTTGTTQGSHFFEGMASANDTAAITYYRNDYSAYRDEAGAETIPYDVFVKDAGKFFQNIPDLKTVNIPGLLVYDASKNAFLSPAGGFGEAPYVTEIVRADEYGQDAYAIRFKQSKKTLGEEVPDMNDPAQYTECTLAVKDNGQGEWVYLAYQKGWDYIPAIPEKPEEPEEPSNPMPDDSLVNPDKNEELSPEFIEKVTDAIEKAENGEQVVVRMNGATEVPVAVLESVKGKDVDVVLDMGTYAWTINGKKVTAEQLKSIDLGVVLNAEVIPEDVVNTVAEGKESIQISLAHDGEFGFEAELELYVGKEHAGKTVSLYYYNEKGKLEFVQKATVAEDGTVVFTFEHASDYLAVIEKKDNVSKEKEIPKTGDQIHVIPYVSMLALAAGIVVLRRKKRITELSA